MDRDQQRQFQIRQERNEARYVDLEQDRDQRDDDQPGDPQAFRLVLAGRARKQPFCVLGHGFPDGRTGGGSHRVVVAGFSVLGAGGGSGVRIGIRGIGDQNGSRRLRLGLGRTRGGRLWRVSRRGSRLRAGGLGSALRCPAVAVRLSALLLLAPRDGAAGRDGVARRRERGCPGSS